LPLASKIDKWVHELETNNRVTADPGKEQQVASEKRRDKRL